MTQQMALTDRTMVLFGDQRARRIRDPFLSPQFGRFESLESSSDFAWLPTDIPDQTIRPSNHRVTISPPSEEVADLLARCIQEYVNTIVMGSARQLFFDDAARILREHNEVIAEPTEQQSILTRQVRFVQGTAPAETTERVALGPFSDRIEQAVGIALDEVGIGGVAEFDGVRLTFKIPPQFEELLIEGEFELYRVLARELPTNVFRVLDIYTEIFE